MKHFPKTAISLFLTLSLLVGANLSPLVAHAAGASIYLRANKASVANGGSLIIAVYMNGGGSPINAVEADLNYPSSKLQYVGLSYSGSAFSINTPSNGGGSGAVSIQNGTVSPVSGTGLVVTVTFKALVGSGSASIGVSGSSNLVNANDNSAVPYSGVGTSVNFGAESAASSSSGGGSSAPATPAAPKDTTPPIISAIKVQTLTPFSATITWTTNEPADSAVEYGLDTSYGLSNSTAGLTTTHSVALSSTFLTPETTFHYHVKSADASGNVATSPDQTLNLPGVPVTVVVMGPDGKPQVGALVTLDGSTATTDSKGSVTLPSSLGNKKITTTYQGVTVEKPITVSKTAKPLPPYQLDLAKQPLNGWMLTSIGLIVVVLTLLGIDAMLFGSRLFAKLVGIHFIPKHLLPAHHAATVAVAGAVASKPAPDPTPSPIPPASDKPEPPLDPTKTIAELMGPEPLTPTANPVTRIAVSTPLEVEQPTTEIAQRLKKPIHKVHPKSPKKPKK